MHLDRRLTWGETKQSATAEIREICDDKTTVVIPIYDRKSYRGTVYEQVKYYPTWKMPATHFLVGAGSRAYAMLFGELPRIGRWTFSTNGVAICGKHQIPCIGFGPGNEVHAHAPNEAIPVKDLVRASAFYTILPFILQGETE
jgi:putative selenium metabolism hydrolase